MPAFFVKNTKSGKGIVVSNKPITKRTIEMKNGMKRTISTQQSDLKFGFFAMEEGNAAELGYVAGEEVPVSLSNSPVIDQDGTKLDLVWCNPD